MLLQEKLAGPAVCMSRNPLKIRNFAIQAIIGAIENQVRLGKFDMPSSLVAELAPKEDALPLVRTAEARLLRSLRRMLKQPGALDNPATHFRMNAHGICQKIRKEIEPDRHAARQRLKEHQQALSYMGWANPELVD